MWTGIWKASLISLAGYAVAALIMLWTGFWLVLLTVPALQAAWGIFCIARLVQLRRSGAQKAEAAVSEREAYGFSLGGLVSSSALLCVLVAFSQAI